MIDERHEELAAFYALGLLEGDELARFQTALDQDPKLQTLVRELRESAATLAHAAPPAQPPAALKARVLASIAATAPAARPTDNIIRGTDFRPAQIFPWAAAACLALAAAWFGQRYLSTRSETVMLQDQKTLAELELQSTRNQLEAERLVVRQKLADLTAESADASKKLTDAQQRLATADAQLASHAQQLAESTRQLATAARDSETLSQQLTTARSQLATLDGELKSQGALADLKITALVSKLNNSPEARAIAVWNPGKQEGVLTVEKLPALAADKSYQLWVVDPQYPNPVDGGIFTVDPATGEARITFKSKQPVKSIAAFAVTLERKGGVTKAEGPFVLLGK